ncbi:hypothetical protein GCM10010176_051550 [Nonomuraea spiralis]|nr:hypothetical protein GCM10010176_051550 [Nonomuraea spiralis]
METDLVIARGGSWPGRATADAVPSVPSGRYSEGGAGALIRRTHAIAPTGDYRGTAVTNHAHDAGPHLHLSSAHLPPAHLPRPPLTWAPLTWAPFAPVLGRCR